MSAEEGEVCRLSKSAMKGNALLTAIDATFRDRAQLAGNVIIRNCVHIILQTRSRTPSRIPKDPHCDWTKMEAWACRRALIRDT
jgi:hypothetical protein